MDGPINSVVEPHSGPLCVGPLEPSSIQPINGPMNMVVEPCTGPLVINVDLQNALDMGLLNNVSCLVPYSDMIED